MSRRGRRVRLLALRGTHAGVRRSRALSLIRLRARDPPTDGCDQGRKKDRSSSGLILDRHVRDSGPQLVPDWRQISKVRTA